LGLGEAPILLFPGDAEPGGGLRTLAHAARTIFRETEAHLVVSCRAKSHAGAEVLQKVEYEMSARGWAARFHVMGASDDFHALLAVSSVCVLPATTYRAKIDYPYALLEAMSLGVPAVVCHGTPPAELVCEGGGAVVEPCSAQAVARGVIALLGDVSAQRWSSEAARETVRRVCDPLEAARRYARLHEELMADRGKGGRPDWRASWM
jgi:glycosyltransferase involved in cell wall biosynthesis